MEKLTNTNKSNHITVQEGEEETPSNNPPFSSYFKIFFKNYYILISLLIYYILLFSLEPLIRQPLFDLSVKFTSNYHSKFPDKSSFVYKVCIFLAYVPKEQVMITVFFIIYTACNLMKTFAFMFSVTTSIGVIGFLKLIYKNLYSDIRID